MTLTLFGLASKEQPRVAHLRVAPDQIRFSGTVAQAFETAETNVDFHGIAKDSSVVGFFKIDRGYSAKYDFATPTDIGLRAFLIDLGQQEKGHGTTACRALPAYLNPLYPQAKTLWLTVNVINLAAVRSYRNGGFDDTGQIWPHGEAGPQHVMRCALHA